VESIGCWQFSWLPRLCCRPYRQTDGPGNNQLLAIAARSPKTLRAGRNQSPYSEKTMLVCRFYHCRETAETEGMCQRHLGFAPTRCKFSGCLEQAARKSDGWCRWHFRQLKEQKTLTSFPQPTAQRRAPRPTRCIAFTGCNRKTITADGYCMAHHAQRRAGRPLTPIQKNRRGFSTEQELIEFAIAVLAHYTPRVENASSSE
jgi:hypothetical protein